jgi:nickel superoxide dismutase
MVMNRTRTVLAAAVVAAALAGWVSSPFAHCEIPCGIYHDEVQIELIKEHIQTIEKSMKQIEELSKASPINYNQLIRWTTNKDDHANKLQEIVTQYFMTQRLKPSEGADEATREAYLAKLTLLHGMLVTAMKTKQTTDLTHVEALKKMTSDFYEAYFGRADKMHLKEHHE